MDVKTIGQNIRRLREQAGLTLSVVAKRANITISPLSKIEKGQTSAPISTLISIAEALGVPLSKLVEASTQQPDFVVTRKGKGQIVERDGTNFGYAYEALAAEMPDKCAEPFLLTSLAKDKPGVFQHGGEEFLYVLSGKIEMHIGDSSVTLSKGDSLYFNPRLPHFGKVVGTKPAKTLCMFIRSNATANKRPKSRT